MAAYAAVISLKQTINSLLLDSSRISSLLSSTREILQVAYNETTSLQHVLEKLNDSSKKSSKRLDALEAQIRDFANQFEDVIEFHELDLQDEAVMRQEITSFGEAVKEMEKDYIDELSKPEEEEEEDDDDDDVSSNIDFGVEMVGYSDDFRDMIYRLIRRMRPDDLCFLSLYGEHGCGKTAVAKTIFEEEVRDFDCGAWVTIGAEHQTKQVLMRIIDQVEDDSNKNNNEAEAEDEDEAEDEWSILVLICYYFQLCCDTIIAKVEKFRVLICYYIAKYEAKAEYEDEYKNALSISRLCYYLHLILKQRKYMIVLNDVRDVELVEWLQRSLPDESNGSMVIVTTSLEAVLPLTYNNRHFKVNSQYFYGTIRLFLRALIFDWEEIPPELEEAGKKIIENCGGLLIAAAKTLLLLKRTEKSVEQWSKIAADQENPIFMVEDEISEISKIKTEMKSWDMDDKKIKSMVEYMSLCVDFPDHVEYVNLKMRPERFFLRLQIISLWGMAGIGKTTFARKLFKEESILSHFNHHVWITLGQKYQKEEILIDILAQVYPDIDKLHMKGDEKLTRKLCVQLSRTRCLIVLDDLCSKEPIHHLKNLFPDIKGAILVTTRLVKVAKYGRDDTDFEMHLLDTEESWSLLRQKVFGEGSCPPELEKVGRKIAEKCDGLPLLILTIADQLLKVNNMSEEYWNNVASGKEKQVFMNAHDQISKALLPSYKSLPQHLKACFLYIGVFLEKYETSQSKLTNMWIAEGLVELNSSQTVEDYAAECLSELVEKSLVVVQRKVSDDQISTCRLHAVFWHLSNSQAVKNKFFHAMNSYDDCSIENMKSQRRLCIRNSILLGIKDVQLSMASNTSAHSLLCVSALKQYPVPLNFELRLLRVMNALTIRLFEFPLEVVRLVHMRYLGLTCNGKLPSSISKLWKLQYLIVNRYMNIRSFDNSWALPVEIWDMKELKHLQVMGGWIPNHKCGTGLLKLSTLLDVSVQSCRKKVLKWIPNLKRLGIRIELVPGDEGNSFRCLNRISRLHKLESLKCVVVNPQIRSQVVIPPPVPFSMFPAGLKELSLSGLGYPWSYMSIIGKLENLQVLKLKHYAFQGPKWEMDITGSFDKLKFLLVEDTDLVHWKINLYVIMRLERLHIKHCYKLQEIPDALPISSFTKIEIVDCNPLIVAWAEKMGQTTTICKPNVDLSWLANK